VLNGRVRFGPFEANPASGELWRDGSPVPIQDLPFRLLAALLERPGEVVTRAELTAHLWGNETFVDAAAGLNTAVAKLREALDDAAERPTYVETVPKRGYRFVGKIEDAGVATEATLKGRPTSTLNGRPTSTLNGRAASTHVGRGFSLAGVAAGVGRRFSVAAMAAGVIALAIGWFAAYRLTADPGRTRVAVVLFDNETGDAALAPFAQGLTDATVTELTADARLAVIGNAAILRTTRPFRDIQAIRDNLDADFIVIGQVQARDGDTLVRAHLIRARDQAHVWVDAAQRANRTEAALQADVAGRIRSAVAKAIDR
jgi:DNA-binding winged helix-turn-helix (wHTH) protein/TolB-like protein